MKQFIRPEFKLQKEELSTNYGKFLVEPLERGFGITLGNALRRTLLSATPGAAVFGIRIKNAAHEFTAIPGIVEHVTKIILNIKNLILEINTDIIMDDEFVVLKIFSNIEGPILAKDIICPNGVIVLNKDLHIATISQNGELDIELYARNARGYKSFHDNKKEKKYADLIVIDSNYSPIVQITYNVEPTKVGENNDLEKLEIEVKTDGSITPINALAIAAKILIEYLNFFVNLNEKIKILKVISLAEEKKDDQLNKSIDELEFGQRSQNCLKRAKIELLQDLISKTEEEIKGIRNLGKKSFQEIKDKITKLGFVFKKE